MVKKSGSRASWSGGTVVFAGCDGAGSGRMPFEGSRSDFT